MYVGEVVGRLWASRQAGALSGLKGTIRDHVTRKRRPFVRFFAGTEDLSHDPTDAPLPDAVARGSEPLVILGAIAGG